MKLFPLLAASFTFMMTEDYLKQLNTRMLKETAKGKFELLDVMHHFTAGLKSFCSQTANDGLYLLRQAIGGAGYTVWSGIPGIIDHFNPVVTYEGDNTMLLQQSAKYLMKLYKKVKSGEKVTEIFEYLNELPNLHLLKSQANSVEDFLKLSHIENNLKAISLFCIEHTMTEFNESKEHKTAKTNMIFATNIVKMALIHIKLLNIMVSAKRVA